ncbi:hypothetical protein FB45DRAFT_1008336 [Roridomyces roridus]|uniref:Uncharacterized protein n=1 Tax=Roridomyces roridus TaxID=1738132 RepID=A0AAD7BAZ1_9AGAR|nr:hypothetical protein FB45DRAFT_1008336 [Roridomyces roridus]
MVIVPLVHSVILVRLVTLTILVLLAPLVTLTVPALVVTASNRLSGVHLRTNLGCVITNDERSCLGFFRRTGLQCPHEPCIAFTPCPVHTASP